MKISLIHPSRGRPQKAKEAYDFWMLNASGEIEIEHILSLDFSDPKNEDYGMGDDLKYTGFGPNSKMTIDKNECVVEAANQAAQLSTGDILVYLSDDFKCPKDWDKLIVARLDITKKQLLRVNDGYQPMENAVLTIPIMTRELYKHLGYFFYHEYKSMWVDVDLYFTCQPFMITEPTLLFPHEHPVTGKCQTDETYQRSNKNFESGREIINRRSREFGWGVAYKKMPV